MKIVNSLLILALLASCAGNNSDKEATEEKHQDAALNYKPIKGNGWLYVRCFKENKEVYREKKEWFLLEGTPEGKESDFDRCIIDG